MLTSCTAEVMKLYVTCRKGDIYYPYDPLNYLFVLENSRVRIYPYVIFANKVLWRITFAVNKLVFKCVRFYKLFMCRTDINIEFDLI